MLPGANLSRAIARAGFDWVCVDCEHGNIAGMTGIHCITLISKACSLNGKDAVTLTADVHTDAQIHESVAAIASCGVSPIVRIPDNQGWMVMELSFRYFIPLTMLANLSHQPNSPRWPTRIRLTIQHGRIRRPRRNERGGILATGQ